MNRAEILKKIDILLDAGSKRIWLATTKSEDVLQFLEKKGFNELVLKNIYSEDLEDFRKVIMGGIVEYSLPSLRKIEDDSNMGMCFADI